MKEIGEKLKEARESMGISIEEAAEDLKLRPSQLKNIEEGNRDAFKDIFYLKYFIRDYSKYLGLNYEEIVEDFNEFVFDYTSKISIEDIKKEAEKNNKDKKQVKKVTSPYTIDKDSKKGVSKTLIYIIIAIILCIAVACVIIFVNNTNDEDTKDNTISEVAYQTR